MSRYPSFHKEALVMKFTDPDARHIFEDVEKKQLVLITMLLDSTAQAMNPGSGGSDNGHPQRS